MPRKNKRNRFVDIEAKGPSKKTRRAHRVICTIHVPRVVQWYRGGGGNTLPPPPFQERAFCFTLNDPTEEDIELVLQHCEADPRNKYIIGYEVHGTVVQWYSVCWQEGDVKERPHLQGYYYLKVRCWSCVAVPPALLLSLHNLYFARSASPRSSACRRLILFNVT